MTADYLAEWWKILLFNFSLRGCRLLLYASVLNLSLSARKMSKRSVLLLQACCKTRTHRGGVRERNRDGMLYLLSALACVGKDMKVKTRPFYDSQEEQEGERSPSYIGCDIKHSFLLPFYTIESRNHFSISKIGVCVYARVEKREERGTRSDTFRQSFYASLERSRRIIDDFSCFSQSFCDLSPSLKVLKL